MLFSYLLTYFLSFFLSFFLSSLSHTFSLSLSHSLSCVLFYSFQVEKISEPSVSPSSSAYLLFYMRRDVIGADISDLLEKMSADDLSEDADPSNVADNGTSIRGNDSQGSPATDSRIRVADSTAYPTALAQGIKGNAKVSPGKATTTTDSKTAVTSNGGKLSTNIDRGKLLLLFNLKLFCVIDVIAVV